MLRIEEDLVEQWELYCVVDKEGRVAELLRVGLEEWLPSDCVTESLEGLVLETDLTKELLLDAAPKVG